MKKSMRYGSSARDPPLPAIYATGSDEASQAPLGCWAGWGSSPGGHALRGARAIRKVKTEREGCRLFCSPVRGGQGDQRVPVNRRKSWRDRPVRGQAMGVKRAASAARLPGVSGSGGGSGLSRDTSQRAHPVEESGIDRRAQGAGRLIEDAHTPGSSSTLHGPCGGINRSGRAAHPGETGSRRAAGLFEKVRKFRDDELKSSRPWPT
jgi:hypothetical protein